MSSTDLLKKSLQNLYYNEPDILYLLDSVDFTQLAWHWERELYSRISKESYEEVEKFLASDLYREYSEAVNRATVGITQPLAKLIEFVLTPNLGENH